MKQRTEVLPYIFLAQHGNVCVDISCGAQFGMAQPLRDIFQLPARIVENARRTVTNVMKTQARKSMLFQYLLKSTGYIIRTVIGGKTSIRVGVINAEGPPVPIPGTPHLQVNAKLSSVVPKILGWRRSGKIGMRQHDDRG